MAENYKHLYQQTKQMLAVYQDDLVPGFRKQIEELEQNQIPVRCKDCKFFVPLVKPYHKAGQCNRKMIGLVGEEDFCSHGERRTDA